MLPLPSQEDSVPCILGEVCSNISVPKRFEISRQVQNQPSRATSYFLNDTNFSVIEKVVICSPYLEATNSPFS